MTQKREHNAPVDAADLAGQPIERERVDDLPAGHWPLNSPDPTPPAENDPLVEPPVVAVSPVGALTTVGHSHFTYADGREVLPIGATYMWGLGKLRRDRDAALRDLDQIASAGFEWIRSLFALGWYAYWRGSEICPTSFVSREGSAIDAWPDYDERVDEYVRALHARGLGLFWSAGDLQMWSGREDAMRAWARSTGEVIGAAAPGVLVAADVNEAWQNWITDREPAPSEVDRLVIDPLHAGYGGDFLRLRSAPPGEEVHELDAWSRDIWQKHGHRGFHVDEHVSAIRHAWSINYDEAGVPRNRLGFESEPAGPSMDLPAVSNVYGPQTRPEALCLLAIANYLTGAAYCWHSHRGVQCWLGPLSAEAGFASVPAARELLPEDLHSAFTQLVHGGRNDSPFRDGDGFPPDDDRRIDSALSTDGRFVTLVYSAAPGTLLQARRSVEGQVIVPHTGEATDLALNAGESIDLAYECGRLIVGMYV